MVAALGTALPPGSLAPRYYDTSIFCNFESFEQLESETRSKVAVDAHEVLSLADYPAVAGHFYLDTLLQLTDAESICTVLREPRTRLLSLYVFWRTPGMFDNWTPYRADVHAQRPLAEFLSEPCLAPVTDNQLCRLLLRDDARLPPREFAARSDVEAIAADSIERLDTLGFVGVLELGDSAWDGVAQTFGVTLDRRMVDVTGDTIPPLATPPGETIFNPDTVEVIERRCAADLIVYSQALARAGLDESARARVRDGTFAAELVKLGDLIGYSATRAAEQTAIAEALRGELREQKRSGAHAVRQLHDELRRKTLAGRHDREALEAARHRLDTMQSSASWRVTSPLRTAKRRLLASWPDARVISSRRRRALNG